MSPITRFLLCIVGSAFYLGLAVLGWGGFAAFFSNPARTALAVATLAIGVAAFFAGGNLSSGVREDRGNRWVIAALTVIGLVAGYLPALTDRMNFWTIDGDAVRWLGVVLLPSAARCGCGRSMCSATGSAGSSRSSPGTPS